MLRFGLTDAPTLLDFICSFIFCRAKKPVMPKKKVFVARNLSDQEKQKENKVFFIATNFVLP
jgi:hypothetical protein